MTRNLSFNQIQKRQHLKLFIFVNLFQLVSIELILKIIKS